METNNVYTARWNTAICKEYDNDKILWRYMNLEKFLKLISNRKLYFRRLDKLDDQYEGIPIGNHFEKSIKLIKMYNSITNNKYLEAIRMFRQKVYVNCWNQKEEESFLLWKCYANIKNGVAIKSTYQRVKKYFAKYNLDLPLFFCCINYGDTLSNKSDWSVVFTKRKIFSEESEFRIVHSPNDITELGIEIEGDMESLIEEVVLAPNMSIELIEMIKIYLEEHGFCNTIIKKSALEYIEDPMKKWEDIVK
jgi:hypothetical protein